LTDTRLAALPKLVAKLDQKFNIFLSSKYYLTVKYTLIDYENNLKY